MSLSDWFDCLFVFPALYAYWKATAKYLWSHLSGLAGIVGLMIVAAVKGGKPL